MICSKCKAPKSLSEFYLNQTKKERVDNWCKDCHKEWQLANKSIQSAKKKIWYQANKQRLKEKRDNRY